MAKFGACNRAILDKLKGWCVIYFCQSKTSRYWPLLAVSRPSSDYHDERRFLASVLTTG